MLTNYRLCIIALSSLCISCASYGDSSFATAYDPEVDLLDKKRSYEIFLEPEKFDGELVKVCGVIGFGFEDSNIWYSEEKRSFRVLGLAIEADYRSRVLNRLDGKYACLKGIISKSGCASTLICNDTSFDYQIEP